MARVLMMHTVMEEVEEEMKRMVARLADEVGERQESFFREKTLDHYCEGLFLFMQNPLREKRPPGRKPACLPSHATDCGLTIYCRVFSSQRNNNRKRYCEGFFLETPPREKRLFFFYQPTLEETNLP